MISRGPATHSYAAGQTKFRAGPPKEPGPNGTDRCLAARRPDHRLSHDGAVLGDGRLGEDQLVDAPQKRVDSHAYLPA